MVDRTARLLSGAIGGAAGAFTMARVPALRRADDRLTIIILSATARRLLDVPLTSEDVSRWIPIARYSYGTMAGVGYGLVADGTRDPLAAGAAWGIALWIVSDSIALPLAERSSERIGDRPGTLTSLVAHVVYGIATAIVAHVTRVWRSREAMRSRRPT